eukprot:Gregarina_sp_Pseudo_9__1184@NODE_177_length_3814_cov_67_400530_g163_i0_p2_GENE_NODE_177_length_3814_cov_67_400530_g163_i0NODE_177_length_3814_cov_67_400530_g163_i0_p2_ORF_typecomplete_len343_score23_65F_actin_cap_B/PF01115_17/7_6e42Factin_cap_A/PF01267_17/1_7e03Factin_cap_A/PF01267_17/0_21_NODE_177_length_3814_cov_67_400530_g163_i01191147
MDDEQDPLVVGILNLLYSLPPQDTEKDVITTCQLTGDTNIADKVLRRVQRPSKLIYDKISKKYFLGSDFNKIAAYYRSPFSNGFYTRDGTQVADSEVPQNDKKIRQNVKQLEEYLNERFEVYRKAKYPNGVCSVYFWDVVEGEGWAVAILFRNSKLIKATETEEEEFVWDSINVIMQIPRSNQYIYRTKTTIFLTLTIKNAVIGEASWGGRVIKNTTSSRTVGDNAPSIYEDSRSQAEYLSALVEEHEKALAYQIREISLPKTRQAINALRILNPVHANIHEEITAKFNSTAFREDRRLESRVGSRVGSADGPKTQDTIPKSSEPPTSMPDEAESTEHITQG